MPDANNPPAFPNTGNSAWQLPPAEGMSLRDWFAGQALAVAWDARDKGYYEGDDCDMARCAYQIADAMLAERERRG